MQRGARWWLFGGVLWAALASCHRHAPPSDVTANPDGGASEHKGWDGTPHGHFFGWGAPRPQGGAPVATAPSPSPSPSPSDAGPVEALDAGEAPPLYRSPFEPPDAGPHIPNPPTGVTTEGSRITAHRVWAVNLEGVGTSSPRLVDVNGDGVLDVITAAGVQGKSGLVYALDGKTGATLWKAKVGEEIYATVGMVDVDKDGVPEMAAGGRDFDFALWSGKDGTLVWSLRKANPGVKITKRDFNGASAIPDQDGDGVDELLLSQGGSYDDGHRLPGHFFVVSAKAGKILTDIPAPDGRETYSMPTYIPGTKPLQVVLPTGGESLNGHVTLWDLGKGKAIWSYPSLTKGFIASPLVWPQADGGFDLVTVSFDGEVARLSGATGQPKWTARRPGFECTPSPGVGHFGGTGSLDVVAGYFQGAYPEYNWKYLVVWIDGVTGQVLDEQKRGVYAAASPVTADVDGDDFDETFVMSMNGFTAWQSDALSTLTVFDGHRGKAPRLELKFAGAGSATPAVGDLDGDGVLDLIVSYTGHLERFALEVPEAKTPRVRWGGFRGTKFDGIVREP